MTSKNDTRDDVIDLGAATEVTQGIYDPVKKENLVTPQARDF
ncbi:hypothetical protein [Terricaulis sp.]|nr:hypothetical protein [Terricaulis sp.]MDZ4690971.1 hypothetical protein [Terricaulis sp.]